MNDLISRADAIVAFNGANLYQYALPDKAAAEILKSLPSADAGIKCVAQIKVDTEDIVRRIKEEYDITDGWIPCSERLPEKDGWYLISVQGYEKVVDMEWYYSEWGAWNGVSSEQQVIAWMPLPMPYRKDGET